MQEYIKTLDTQALLFFNSHHSSFCDAVMWQVSGKYFWIPLYAALLGYIFYKYRKQSWVIVLAIILVIVLSDQISSTLIKPLVGRLRPSNDPSLTGLIHLVNDYHGGKYGFVSSHAANTFGVAMFFTLLFKNRWFSISIMLWALLVSYSRIYLGVHYPGDVLGGTIVGISSGAFAYWLMKKYSVKYNLLSFSNLQNASH